MENLKKNLIKRGYDVRIFDTEDEAKEYLLKVIDKKSTVGIGGSMTIKELAIDEELQNRGNKVLWHWTAPAKEKKAVRESAGNADIYLCSSNAVTKDGQLVNIDGTCNRIAGMLHGTGKVYMVIGVNKIAKDFEEAISRIKNVACPANAKRLGLNTPAQSRTLYGLYKQRQKCAMLRLFLTESRAHILLKYCLLIRKWGTRKA